MGDTVKWVEVVSADGEPLDGFAHPVPSHWLGTDLLPPGAKRKGRSRSTSKDDGGDEKPEVPAESESRDVLEAYAVANAGISEEDAKAFANKGELHAAIVAAKA